MWPGTLQAYSPRINTLKQLIAIFNVTSHTGQSANKSGAAEIDPKHFATILTVKPCELGSSSACRLFALL